MKKVKRILSFALVLAMCLSLSVSAYAAPGQGSSGRIQPGVSKPQEVPAEEPEAGVIELDGSEEVVEEVAPAKTFYNGDTGLDVVVEAPADAFPEGTTMSVTALSLDAVQDAIDASAYNGRQAVMAVDISFADAAGNEVQPAVPVNVSINSTEVQAGKDPMVLHIADNGEVTEVAGAAVVVSEAEEAGAFLSGGASITNDSTGAIQIVGEKAAESVSISFVATSFSTYTLTWRSGNQNRSATVHIGQLSSTSSAFVELETATWSLDNTDDIDLEEVVESVVGSSYAYMGAIYSANAVHNDTSANNTYELLNSTLTKRNDGGFETTIVSGNNNATRTQEIADGSHIYIFVEEKGTGSYTPPKPEGSSVDPDSVAPDFAKEVTENTDGTYTIKLDITGHQAPVQEGQGANVIVVLDTTRSMSYNMSGSQTSNVPSADQRITAAKTALRTLVSTLKPGDGTGDTNYVNMAFIEFNNQSLANTNPHNWGGGASWTTNQTAINDYIDDIGLTNGSGTNWEVGLRATQNLLNTIPNTDNLKNNATYVIFITDGDPNKCVESSGNNDLHDYRFSASAAAHAQDEANTVANNSYLYGVFCGGSTGAERLGLLIGTAKGEDTISAGSAADLKAAFENIGSIITSNLGSHSVNMDDGLPSLASIQHVVGGEATDFTYYKDGAVWTGAPEATYDASNGVVWDLSSAGKLEDDTVYSIEFTIWPTQASYDLIADLNNGLRSYNADGENPISDAERAQIDANSDGTYTLKTNTHLQASYVNEADGEEYDIPNVPYQGKNMPLPVEPISVKKVWPDNMLDSYGAAAYRDPTTGKTMYAEQIELTLQREVDGVREDYLDIVVSKDGKDGRQDGTYIDEETGEEINAADDNWMVDDIFVSVGFMTVKDGVVDIKETGHDYQIVEPPEFLYYWDLISDVYHPMVINGESTVLVYDPDLTAANPAKGVYEIPADSGRFYYTPDSTSNTLEASNYRRSNLNLSKVIPEGADPDSEFVYKAKVTDAYSTDGNVWFSAWDNAAGGLVTDTWVTGEGVVAQGDGYFYAPNGTELTMTIKTGWNVRFLNVYHGTTFSFEETGMPNNFEFDKVEADTQYDIMLESNKDWYEIDASSTSGKITGKITEPNNNYNITYTNKLKPEFYIYHSGVPGDGNLETIPMSDVNADGTYNLYAKTTEGTLYGGYYLDYADKGTYADDGIKGKDGVAYTGWNCEWSDPQTVDGTKMKPVAGETYYIKEVPTYYLRNYHQILFMKATEADQQELTGLYLISAVDDLNYNSTGFVLKSDDNKDATVVLTMTYRNYATNKSVTLKANTVFKTVGGKAGITQEGEYLTYFDAKSTNYFATGSFTVDPFWITPDGITVNGISTRTITIASMTKSGITKSDS